MNVNFEKVLELSEREYEVFTLLGEGKTASEIAAALDVSVKTVESHNTHIRERLGMEKLTAVRAFATRYAVHCETTGTQRQPLARRIKFRFNAPAIPN